MLEGKELEGKIKIAGEDCGTYSVDLDDSPAVVADATLEKQWEKSLANDAIKLSGKIGLSAGAKIDLKALLKKGAEKLAEKIPGLAGLIK